VTHTVRLLFEFPSGPGDEKLYYEEKSDFVIVVNATNAEHLLSSRFVSLLKQHLGASAIAESTGHTESLNSASAAAAAASAQAGPTAPNVDWKRAAQSGAINKFTIPVLKEYCRANNLHVSGPKPQLLARITAHLALDASAGAAAAAAKK